MPDNDGADWQAIVNQANAIALQWYSVFRDDPIMPTVQPGQTGAALSVSSRGAAVTVSPALIIGGAIVVIAVVYLMK